MKTIKFESSNGNWPDIEEMILAYVKGCFGLLDEINESLKMKTTIQKVNEARRTSGSGKRGNGKKGANKPTNKIKKTT